MTGRGALDKSLGIVLVALCVMIGASTGASAQPAISPAFATVTVDGSPVASGYAVAVLYDAGIFHLWYRDSIVPGLGTLKHATSIYGVAYTTTGTLSFAANPFPTGTAPSLYYDNAAVVGGAAKLIHWTGFGDEGTYADYSYNNSVSDVGGTFGNLAITHQGPIGPVNLPIYTYGQTGGSFGIVNNNWYGQCGSTGQEVCRAPYTDGTPPSVATIYPSVLNAGALLTGLTIPTGYINNHGDVIAGDTGLDMFFTVRDGSGSRFDQQVYWAGSANDGAGWSSPVALFGGAPTLDGGAFGGPFAHPDALWTGTRYLLYVSTQDAAGGYVLAVAASGGAPLIPVPTLSRIGVIGLLLIVAALGFLLLRRV